MLEINGSTKMLAIIGNPVEHSHSPEMHNFLSEKFGNNYAYAAFDVLPENLAAAADGIRALGIAGVNVTAPHKFNILKYLDEISDDAKKLHGQSEVCLHASSEEMEESEDEQPREDYASSTGEEIRQERNDTTS